MQMTLDYWNTLANQFILISSLLSGFSITVVANLLVSKKNNSLSENILKAATVSAGCFLVTVFAMTDILMTTTPGGMMKDVVESDFLIPRAIGMLTFVLGIFSLSTLISLSGWTKSKNTGIFTTIVGVLTLMAIIIILT